MTAYTKEEIKNSLVRTYAWNGYDLGQELNLTYSFADLLPYWENFDFGLSKVVKGTINSITGPQKEAFRAAVERWESVANIHLKEEAPYTFTVEDQRLHILWGYCCCGWCNGRARHSWKHNFPLRIPLGKLGRRYRDCEYRAGRNSEQSA